MSFLLKKSCFDDPAKFSLTSIPQRPFSLFRTEFQLFVVVWLTREDSINDQSPRCLIQSNATGSAHRSFLHSTVPQICFSVVSFAYAQCDLSWFGPWPHPGSHAMLLRNTACMNAACLFPVLSLPNSIGKGSPDDLHFLSKAMAQSDLQRLSVFSQVNSALPSPMINFGSCSPERRLSYGTPGAACERT